MDHNQPESPVATFGLGDWVAIRLSGGAVGRIVELRGPFGPNHIDIYRIAVGRGRRATLVEVRADQLDATTRPARVTRPPGVSSDKPPAAEPTSCQPAATQEDA